MYTVSLHNFWKSSPGKRGVEMFIKKQWIKLIVCAGPGRANKMRFSLFQTAQALNQSSLLTSETEQTSSTLFPINKHLFDASDKNL